VSEPPRHVLKEGKFSSAVPLGRDRFFDILLDNRMLVKPNPRRPKTTNSRHNLPVFCSTEKCDKLEWKPSFSKQPVLFCFSIHKFPFKLRT
jgi:hypothetical protein